MADGLSFALRLIKRRPHSIWEVEQALLKKEVALEDVQGVIDRLKQGRLLDDRSFAWAWIHTRDRLAPRGKILLRQELRQKGLAAELIEEVLRERDQYIKEEEPDQPSEDDLAKVLIKGRERLYSNLSPEVKLRRQIALLQRRGFSYDVIRRILEM